jgi:hypothetical protein
MYFASVLLLLLIFPLISILAEATHFGHGITSSIGKWFVFWAVGVRTLPPRHPASASALLHGG